jgi:YD repeat-containing protein
MARPTSKARGIAKLINSEGTIIRSKVAGVTFDSDQVVTIVGENASSTAVYTTAAELPTTGLTAGSQAFVTSTGRLYISNSSGWYNIALINQAPYWIEQPDGSYSLSTTGASTIITILAGDSDSTAPTYTVTADSDFNTIATISTDSEGADGTRFIITPIDSEGGTAVAGSGIVTFVATDGVNQASVASTFSITFSPNWSSSFAVQKHIVSPTPTQSSSFGNMVAMSGEGNDLLVMSPVYDYAQNTPAYFFSTTNNWTTYSSQTVSASGTGYSGHTSLGFSQKAGCLSGDGNYACIPAFRQGSNLLGRLYIYKKTAGTWAQEATFDGTYDGNFGPYLGSGSMSMNNDGTVLAVGSINDAPGQLNVYTRSGTSWTARTQINGSGTDTSSGDFGRAVVLSSDGSVIAVGHPRWSNIATSEPRKGKVFVYTRSGDAWVSSAEFSPPYDQTYGVGEWGQTVDISSDGLKIIVGAYDFTDSGNRWSYPYDATGRIYVYTRPDSSSTSWSQAAIIDKVTTSNFGGQYEGNQQLKFANDGKFIFTSSSFTDATANSPNQYGVVHVYEDTSVSTDGTAWTERQSIFGSESPLSLTVNKNFGNSIDVSSTGSFVVVGQPSHVESGLTNAGRITILKPA